MRKHVLTRSILPSIKTKEYIYKVKARLENEKLREWEYHALLMPRVCNNHIDPMNRYNEDYSLYCRVCLICVVLFVEVALHSLFCGECRYSPTYPLFTIPFLEVNPFQFIPYKHL